MPRVTEVHPPDRIENFPCGKFVMRGADAADFLQRITTNDLTGLTSGSVRQTLVITDKARIVDSLWIVPQEQSFLVLTAGMNAVTVMSFLERYIIMDDVTMEPVPEGWHVELTFPKHVGGLPGSFYGHEASFTITSADEQRTHGWDRQFETWRVLNGIPAPGKELVPDYNPLELNLWPLISFTKGCYIGQEVIARLETYRKIQRNLCLWTSEEPIGDQRDLLDGHHNGIGRITSIIPSGPQSFGLCVVNARIASVGTEVRNASGQTIVLRTVFQKEGYGRT